MKEPLTGYSNGDKDRHVKSRLLSFVAVLVVLAPTASGAADKPSYYTVCRHLSFAGNDGSHCMPATVLLKTEVMNHGQPFLAIGERPSDPSSYAYYDLSMDVLLYYQIGNKLTDRNKAGEEQWRINYATSVYWCLTPALGSKLNPGSTPVPAVQCGSSHGNWPRSFQGRGTGGLPPDSVSQQILRAAMPSIVRDIPSVPPQGEWHGYRLARTEKGKAPGRMCKELILSDSARKDHVSKVVAAELRGVAAPAVGEATAALTLCEGDDLVLRTTLPEAEMRCRVEPPYDLSSIDTIAGNCAARFGDELKSDRKKL